MMTKNESIKWFLDILKSCYVANDTTQPELLYLLYDKSYVRRNKLSRLNSIYYNINDSEAILPDIGKSELLLIIHCSLYGINCSYDKIYSYLESNYSSNVNELDKFIKGEIFKFNIFSHNDRDFFISHSYLCTSSFSLDLKSSPELYSIDINQLEIKYLDIKKILK